MTTPDRIPRGTAVIVTRDPGDVYDVVVGREYVVHSYVEEEEDPDVPVPYYTLARATDEYGYDDYYAPPAVLEVTRSAAEQQERMKLPEGKEIADFISSALHSGWGDDFEVYESRTLTKAATKENAVFEEPNPFIHGVEFYARRPGGVTFGGIIRLTAIWHTDD